MQILSFQFSLSGSNFILKQLIQDSFLFICGSYHRLTVHFYTTYFTVTHYLLFLQMENERKEWNIEITRLSAELRKAQNDAIQPQEQLKK